MGLSSVLLRGGTRYTSEMVSPELLKQSRCMHTDSPLRSVASRLCGPFNQLIEERRIVDSLGRCVTRPIDGLLINDAVSYGYPIRGDVVHLLRDEAIVLDQQLPLQMRTDLARDLNSAE